MKNIRFGVIVFWMLAGLANSAAAQVSIGIGIGLPTMSIGINVPLLPELVPVPGYPVYYAPRVDANYFFYDGMYWVYQNDNWYASSWYNGPWGIVEPMAVPLFILRIPVSYYRQPPSYFRGWQANAPPRWGQHWGQGWEQRRSGWDKWKRSSAPARAPLPAYQRQYSGDRYPRVEQQHALHSQSYRYQPRDKVVQQHLKQQAGQKGSVPIQRGIQEEPQKRSPGQQENLHVAPHQPGIQPDPHSQPSVREQHEYKQEKVQGQEHGPQGSGGPEHDRGRGPGQKGDDERGR